MKTTVSFLRTLAFACVISLFSACAINKPGGNTFVPQAPSQPGKALVYFYRPLGEKTGYDRTYYIAANQNKIGTILHGGYIPYETSAGSVSLTTNVNMKGLMLMPTMLMDNIAQSGIAAGRLDVRLEAGKTYYVKMHPEKGFYHFKPTLQLVSAEQAVTEIAGCKQVARK